jgi:hypothetical protein
MEHTAGRIEEGGSSGGEPSERLDVGRPECSEGFSSEHFWIDGHRLRAATTPTAKKAVPFPSAAHRSWFLRFGALDVLSTDGDPRMNEISRSDVFRLLSANQRLIERLEAENARLGRGVAELMLEIQALRDALGHPQSEVQPKQVHRPSDRRW